MSLAPGAFILLVDSFANPRHRASLQPRWLFDRARKPTSDAYGALAFLARRTFTIGVGLGHRFQHVNRDVLASLPKTELRSYCSWTSSQKARVGSEDQRYPRRAEPSGPGRLWLLSSSVIACLTRSAWSWFCRA